MWTSSHPVTLLKLTKSNFHAVFGIFHLRADDVQLEKVLHLPLQSGGSFIVNNNDKRPFNKQRGERQVEAAGILHAPVYSQGPIAA